MTWGCTGHCRVYLFRVWVLPYHCVIICKAWESSASKWLTYSYGGAGGAALAWVFPSLYQQPCPLLPPSLVLLQTLTLAFQYRPCPCPLHPRYQSLGPLIPWLRVQLPPSPRHVGHWQPQHTQLSRQWWLQHIQWHVQVQRHCSPM